MTSDLQRIREYVAANPQEWRGLVGDNRTLDDYLAEYIYIPDLYQRLLDDLGI